MSKVLDNNLNLLRKFQPKVFAKLSNYLQGEYKPRDCSVNRILFARTEELIFNILVVCNNKEYLLCDHEDPITESYRWIDKYIDPSDKADVVFGMGMAFHLEVLLTSFTNKQVIVIEPNIELFYQILTVRNLELIIKRSEIMVDEDLDSIMERIHKLFWDTTKGGIQCEPFEVYGEMFYSQWNDLRSKFIKHAENFSVDIATKRYFGQKWIYNNIKNLKVMRDSANAAGLIGKFSGIPGVLVSAGPSLAKNVHLIDALKHHSVIMAAGTAVNVLETYGTTPHFMVGIDASDEVAEKYKAVKSKDIYFIYSNQVSPGAVQDYQGPKFFMNYPVDMYTAEFLQIAGINSPFFLSGPSVANTCFDVLFKMGCNPIILIGQDLAYTEGSTYAGEVKNSTIHQKTEVEKEGFILTQDIYGNDVYTRTAMLAMKNWFEGYFEKTGDKVQIINATEGGLNIQFAENKALEDVIKTLPCKDIDIGEIIQCAYNNSMVQNRFEEFYDKYRQMIKAEIVNLENYAKEHLSFVELIRKDVYHPSKNKGAFDKIVYRIGEMSERVIKSPIYHSLLKNLVEIEFYLVKMEVDQATKMLTKYHEVKDIYIHAALKQNEILISKLNILKTYLCES